MRLIVLLVLCGCTALTGPPRSDGQLKARPHPLGVPPPRHAPDSGRHALELGGARDGLFYVPKTWRSGGPLLVLLHGARGSSQRILEKVEPLADELGLLVLAPESRGVTWDGAVGDLGPDVDFVDRALGAIFERYAVDPKRLALAGFSDGATEALSLGMTNGLLFSHLLAFSPAGATPPARAGWPRIFISHGTADRILPIANSRVLVPRLQRAGYDVSYHEFDGPHTVPPDLLRAGLHWLLEK